MTQEDIIRMAREAGIFAFGDIRLHPHQLKHFATLVAAAEREACAAVSEDCGAIHVAKRIYARGQA